MAHAAVVQSTIARGRITGFDLTEAERAPGVLKILTYQNAPRLGKIPEISPVDPAGTPDHPLQDDLVQHQNQHTGVVIAETLEQARWRRRASASLMRRRRR